MRRFALERAAHVTETSRYGTSTLPRGIDRYLEQLSQQHTGTLNDPIPGYCLLNQVGHFSDDDEDIDSHAEENEGEQREERRLAVRSGDSPFSFEEISTPPSVPFGGNNDEAPRVGPQSLPGVGTSASGTSPELNRNERRTRNDHGRHARLSDFPRALPPPLMEEGGTAADPWSDQEVDEEYFLSHPENFEKQDSEVGVEQIGSESAPSRVEPSPLLVSSPQPARSSTTSSPLNTSLLPPDGRKQNGGPILRRARLRRASSVYGAAEYTNDGGSQDEEDKRTKKKSALSDFSTIVDTKRNKKKNRRGSTKGTSPLSVEKEHATVEFGMLGEA